MRVSIPEGSDPLSHVWGTMVPGIGPAAARLSTKVYTDSTLGLVEFEAARLRIAQINGCVLCQDWRTERDGRTISDEIGAEAAATFFDDVEAWSASDTLDPRARLAAEYAERFALDHHSIDDEVWGRLRSAFSETELVELTMCLGTWIAFGRLNRVLGLDTACALTPDAIGTHP